MSAVTTIAGPVRRTAYDVTLQLPDLEPARYRMEARNLDALADLIEAEVCTHTREHVGVRLDTEHTIHVRYGFAPSFRAGAWRAATGGNAS